MILASPTSLNQHIDMYSIIRLKRMQISMLGYPDHHYDRSANIERDRLNEVRNKGGGKNNKKKGPKSRGGDRQNQGNDRRKPEESETRE